MPRTAHRTPTRNHPQKRPHAASSSTEDNRLHTVADDRSYSYYAYDHTGQRVLKLTGASDQLDINADFLRTHTVLTEPTLYPSPYIVLSNHGYTKHYYAGSERVAARIGGGNLDHDTACIVADEEATERADRLFDWCLRQVKETAIAPLDLSSLDIRTIDGDRMDAPWWLDEAPAGLEAGLKLNVWKLLHAMDLLSSPSTVPPDTDDEPDVYFYHSDHLGSASWITEAGGKPVQHIQYLPYGEPFVNQRVSGYNERFTFTSKERDEETGYSYFSARYLDHEILTSFLSVDRYADKYPSISPYVYCAWNPIKLTDPTGDTIFNAYEKYKDVSKDIQSLTREKEQASGLRNIIKRLYIGNKIRNLEGNNLKYQKVQGALDAFKEANPEEYNRLDRLSYNGKCVNIYVSTSDELRSSRGATGTTHPYFMVNSNTGEVVSIKRINITLYRLAFLGGGNGLSTLANEFGDAIFAVTAPERQIRGYDNMQNYRQGYHGEASSKFSFDYENYIMNPGKRELPNPNNYY